MECTPTFACFRIKNSKPPQPPFLKSELKRCSQYAKPVFHAALKIDRRSLRKIFRWTGDFPNSEPEVGALRQHLVIKDKVVGIFDQRQFGKDLTAECSIPCVIFGNFDPQKKILKSSQKPIKNVFVERHSPAQRLPPDDS